MPNSDLDSYVIEISARDNGYPPYKKKGKSISEYKSLSEDSYGFKNDNRCYSLLFSGNTGVGKTYLAKEYAYNITNNYIKLDMNEYTLKESINKLKK